MNLRNSKWMLRASSLVLTLILCFVFTFPVQADKKSDQLQGDLSNLNKELKTLEKELDEISSKVKQTSSRLEKTKKELAIATGKEQAQKKAMSLRIKNMYENSGLGAIELLLTSSCLAEFLTRVEYISQVAEYDRGLLEKYKSTQEQVAAQEAQLLEDQEYLSQLQSQLSKKETDLRKKISKTSSDLSYYLAKLEDAKQEANNAQSSSKEEVKPVVPNTGGSSGSGATTTPSTGAGVSYTSSDVTLLAALIECEAGSTNYEGMLAVGSVVVNRMKHRKFPNTLYGVVYHVGQFPPAHDGKVDRVLKRGVKASCVKAATDALNGKNNVGSCLYFRSASSGRQGIIIGGNVFF